MNAKSYHISFIISIIIPLLLTFSSCDNKGIPEHLLLDVNPGDPLYTSYAAAMENSSFIIDQGYEFVFDNNDRSIIFSSSTGGSIGFGFVNNDEWISKPLEMVSPPQITSSFPDMVSFNFEALDNIFCNGTFIVSSSSSAILDLEISNHSNESKSFSLVPYIENNERLFTNISGDQNSFIFNSEKYPDSWTLSHNLPHQDTLLNIFTVSSGTVIKKACTGKDNKAPSLPYSINPEVNTRNLIISGRIYDQKGERINLSPSDLRLSIINHDRSEIITASCPLSGTMIKPYNDGYFQLNAGNFSSPLNNNRLTVNCYLPNHRLISQFDTVVTNTVKSFRKDLHTNPYSFPFQASDIKVSGSNSNILLKWDNSDNDFLYDIYRRTDNDKCFNRIAKHNDSGSFLDKDITPSALNRYLIIPYNPETNEYGTTSREVSSLQAVSFNSFILNEEDQNPSGNIASILSFKENITLEAGETKHIRIIRATVAPEKGIEELNIKANQLFGKRISQYQKNNIKLFKDLKPLLTSNRDINLLLISSFNMMRQVMYPPEGKSNYNYYVFSREPVWGWGHGGQVFHESITMLAYGILFPESAMNSQRVFSERQYDNGYINYRTGSYLDEIIEHNNELTSSAPWYAWLNWEIYRMTGDNEFLEEMYESSKKFYEFYISSRDKDNDGLCEWGGHAVLESVRDALVAVWDEVGWPSEFEGVDINSMLVKEAKSLEKMAIELGLNDEAKKWADDYKHRSELINRICWDSVDGFYYNADKSDNDFSYKKENDLKREEIIGFLPLWAGIASDEQAQIIVGKLTDPDKFWRKNGIPSLSASDPYYNDKGYWNGPVWVEWNYLIMRGLLDYGYEEEARKLVENVAAVMIEKLADDHNLWEFYSPDDSWGGYHKTYIWAGIINRMLIETGIVNYENLINIK